MIQDDFKYDFLMELSEDTRKIIGYALIRDYSFTPWGEDQNMATKLWRLGHKLVGTPGFDK